MGTSDTFKTVIDAFRHYHIHSVPVIRTQEHLQGGQVVGFIDMLDIATIVARSFPCGRSLTEEEADKLSECTQQLGNTPAWGLINACHKDLHFSIHQPHSPSVGGGRHRAPRGPQTPWSGDIDRHLSYCGWHALAGGEGLHACRRSSTTEKHALDVRVS